MIDIWNPGTLPEGLTPESLNGKHESIPINPLIAKMLFLIKEIEQRGTGTNEMVNMCCASICSLNSLCASLSDISYYHHTEQ